MCDEEDMDIQDDLLMEVPSDEKSTSNNSMDIENVEKISSFNSVICEKDIDEDAEILVEVPPLEEKSASNNNNNSTDSIKDTLMTCDEDMDADLSVEDPPLHEKSTSSTDSEHGKRSFVDSLLDKIRRSNSDSSGSEISKFKQHPSDSEEDLLVEVEAPVRYSTSANPNLLPTPIVRNQRSTSAFVNTEEEYRKAIAKHKPKSASPLDFKSAHSSQSEAPRMQAPSTNIQRPRTLAEKRQMVNNNVKFLMVEQESKIFRQVQRKNERLDLNYNLLDSMMRHDVPINHGPYKVLTWLRTREGNFTMQYLNIGGESFKLNGSRGNHRAKYVSAKSSDPLPKNQKTTLRPTRCCKGGRISKTFLKSLYSMKGIKRFVLEESVDPCKRMDTKFLENQLVSIKPRPLSKKVEFMNMNRKLFRNDEDSAFLGDYARFRMPEVKLQLHVAPKTPLDPLVKRYLNEIVPHNDLDKNWCEFALTSLPAKEDFEKGRDNFEFTIPYQDNKREILVRQIIRSKEDNEPLRILHTVDADEPEVDEMEWTFCQDADKDDPVECEVVEIIKDLANSVFINLNDDLFTKEDTNDRKISPTSSPMKSKEVLDDLSSMVKPDTSKRLMMELKRLNANVYKTESSIIENENDMRRNATAHLGKIERELRPTVIVTELDTVLLSEKESRRVKRAPKKFDDYENSMNRSLNSESDNDEPAAKKLKPSNAAEDEDRPFKTRRPLALQQEYEELKSIKQEVKKMLHVSVDVRRMDEVDDLETWCMIHKLYKCYCKGMLPIEHFAMIPPVVEKRKLEPVKLASKPMPSSFVASNVINLKKQKMTAPEEESRPESEEELIDDGYSRRVLPVSIDANKGKPRASAILNSPDGTPKIEVGNLCELINGGIGPIFINVYDDKSMRLNPILRSVLNNKSAIIYFDGAGYFIDKTRVDVSKLDFSSVMEELDHPIFIIQAKDSFPSPVSSTMADDFVKVIFRAESDEVIQIRDRTALNELAEIIESILRNVRKKIESKIDGEPNELVKEQLSMITRDRSKSSSTAGSVSSTHSSPLSFQGKKLTEAPPPGNKTQLMQEFNQIFSSRMKRLVGLISSNSMGLSPSNEMLNKFYIYQWHFLLQSFEEDLIQIWQVRLESENGVGFQMLALTDSREVPDIEHAEKENIVNIRKLAISDDITELTRLILLRVENASMKNMTVLLYGCKGYFRVCGILNSKEHYINGFVAKPTRETHPRIAAKIQKIYHIWHASRQARKNKVFQEMRIVEAKANQQKSAAINGKKTGQADFKWFLFNITNDFSDIYIKSWSRYLSYKVIMDVINRAKAKNRAVALTTNPQNLKRWPRIFALPGPPLKFKDHESMTENFLIFGPYLRNSNSNLLLMQNVDGDLMLRDEYEKRNNVQRTKRTRCLWIYANTLQCLHDADPYPVRLVWGNGDEATQKPNLFNTERKSMDISNVARGLVEKDEEMNDQE